MNDVNFVDRIIGWLSPGWGESRLKARLKLRNYEAALHGRTSDYLPPQNMPPEATDAPYRSPVRGRARHLERNGDVMEGVLNALTRNIVGNGYALEAKVENSRGRQLDVINDRIEEIWNTWCMAGNCDITGESSFSELLEMVLRRWEVDGEVFILKLMPNDGYLPLKLQLLEPDMLAEDVFQHGDNYVFGGVEVDRYMRPVAYHFRPDPMPYLRNTDVVRIPASDVIHIFTKKRPQQIRGLSDLAVSMDRIRHIEEYVKSELEAARSAANIAGVIKTDNPDKFGGGGPALKNRTRGKEGEGQKTVQIPENSLLYLEPEEEAQFAQPGRPNPAAPNFLSMILRLIAMSQGISYETLTRDLTKINFSSHRGGQLEDRKTYVRKQKKLIAKFCDKVYEDWFLEAAVLSGRLLLNNFFADEKARQKYTRHKWITPGWQWVDPVKEAQAAQIQLGLGLTTLDKLCGEQNMDWQENMKQRQKEIETCREMGIELPWFTPQEMSPVEIEDEENGKNKAQNEQE